MKKKLVTILCVTTITASMLAGCGSKTAETTAPTETTAVTETAAAKLFEQNGKVYYSYMD